MKTLYAAKSLVHLHILYLLENQNPHSIRKLVEKSLERNDEHVDIKTPVLKNYPNIFRKILINKFTKIICKYTGLDSFEIFYTFLGSEKGRHMKELSIDRTGEPLPKMINIKTIIDAVNLGMNC